MVERVSNSGFLDAARQALVRRFVGRTSMLASLEASLDEARGEPRLVHVLGPGGIGKTALLTVFAEQVAGRARLHWLLAGALAHDEARLVEALGLPLPELGRGKVVDVLILDGCEKDRALLDWMLDAALPRAGARILVITASREPFGAPGPVRAALAPVTRELRLRPLSIEETVEALARRGVPEPKRAELAQLAAGLPRAVVELGEKSRVDRPTPLAERPPHELVDAVATGLTRDAPTPLHRRAIEALSVALALDQPLLGAMLGAPMAEEELGAVYEWLGALSFVVRDIRGLVPHPRVRSALHRDLCGRDPVSRRELGRRAAAELTARADGVGPATRHHLVVESLFAQRDVLAASPGSVALLEGAREERLRRATTKDAAAVASWLDEGSPLARQLAARWAAEPSSLFVVARTGPPTAAALACAPDEPGAIDLVLFGPKAERAAPSSPELAALLGALLVLVEERADRGRLVVSAPEGLDDLAGDLGLSPLGRPGLLPGQHLFALELIPSGAPEPRVLDLIRRITQGDSSPPRSIPSPPVDPPARGPSAPRVELKGEAVRAALAARHRPHELKRSPLVGLRIVQRRVAAGASPEQALGAVLDEVCRGLSGSPAYAAAARLLEVTYLDPTTVKQEAAAAELRLPFGTYRYQLRRALELVTEELAVREQSLDGG